MLSGWSWQSQMLALKDLRVYLVMIGVRPKLDELVSFGYFSQLHDAFMCSRLDSTRLSF